MSKVFTVGTFDIPHMGHALFLERCAKFGELHVGLNTDEYIEEYKGARPVFTFQERFDILSLFGCIKQVYANGADNPIKLLTKIQPDFIVIGSDWGDRYFQQIEMDRQELKEMGIIMIYLPYTQEISTTMIKERCKKL